MPYGPSKSTQAINADKQLVQFTLADAERIGHVVSRVESERRGRKGSTLPRAAGGGGMQFALFTGAWNVGQSKVVKMQADTNSTTSVTNVFHPNVGFSTAERVCMISSGTLILVRC